MVNNHPIGVFDSGVGGLTVFKKLVDSLPNENYLYFGDTARVPYGEKSVQELITFSRDILNWFKNQNVKAVLIACNTSSAVALDVVKTEYKFPVLGLIQPTVNHLSTLTQKKIGLIATSATVNSQAYSKALYKLNKGKQIIEVACPGLVEIVESDKLTEPDSITLIKSYILPLLNANVEKIILGCTHFPYLAGIINEITGNQCDLIDPADYLIAHTKKILNELNILNQSKNKGSRAYFVSSNPEKFVAVGNKFYSDCILAKEITL